MKSMIALSIIEEKRLDDLFDIAGLMDDSEYAIKWNGEHKEQLKATAGFNPLWNHSECMARVERARRFKNMTLIERKIKVEEYFIKLIAEKVHTEKDRKKKSKLLNIQREAEEYLEKLKNMNNV